MHRDLKLGLALAVLLIGATAAFFFRSETEPNLGLPRLQNPERLDAELAGRDVAPYLGEPESDPAATAQSPWAKPAFLGGSTAEVRRTSVTPDPIRIVVGDDAELIESGPEMPVPETKPPAASTAGERTHVVKAGDTLTGLAAQYLGSTSRFGDIFDLNRDRLARPDDLRVGMTLRIPPAGPVTESAPVTGSSVAREAPPAEASGTEQARPSETAPAEVAVDPSRPAGEPGASPDAGKLFVPARKTPFVPSRYRTPGTPAAKADGPVAPERE